MKLTEAKLKQMILESLEKRAAMASDMNTKGLPMGTYSANHYGDEPMSDYLERGRPIKKLFHQYADHDFMNSLITVHYRDLDELENFESEVSSRDELSCVAYKPGENYKFGHPLGSSGVGLAVKGRITLLVNDTAKMVSGMGGAYKHHYPERTRDSGANKGVGVVPSIYDIVSDNSAYVLDEEDFQPKEGNVRQNEALVDNWKVFAYIASDEASEDYIRSLISAGKIQPKRVVSPSEFAVLLKHFNP